MKKTPFLIALAVACGLGMQATHGTIISGQVTGGVGSFVKLSIPFSESNPDNTVGNNTFQDNNLYGFDEGQNIELLANLSVDILADGLGGGLGVGNLLAGTVVASHYVFFDPRPSRSQEGHVNFDSDVLGVITSTALLNGSDFLLNNGVNYQKPGLRGLEGGDNVWISGMQQISVDWTASTPGDYVRVLTAYSPAAARVPDAGTTAGLMLGAMLLLVGIRGRLSAR